MPPMIMAGPFPWASAADCTGSESMPNDDGDCADANWQVLLASDSGCEEAQIFPHR